MLNKKDTYLFWNKININMHNRYIWISVYREPDRKSIKDTKPAGIFPACNLIVPIGEGVKKNLDF